MCYSFVVCYVTWIARWNISIDRVLIVRSNNRIPTVRVACLIKYVYHTLVQANMSDARTSGNTNTKQILTYVVVCL